jgi:TolA-binding protein
MTALSEDLQAMLDAERDIDAPTPAQRERLLERLEPLLIVPVAAAVASAGAADAATSALGGALKAKIAAAVVSAALIGGAVGATGHAYLAPAPVPSAVVPVAPKPFELPAPAPEPIVPAEPAPSASAPSATAAPSLGAAPRERKQHESSLRAERLLIETASAALLRGDHESALAALREHARRFPKGNLAQERDVLLTKARAGRSR